MKREMKNQISDVIFGGPQNWNLTFAVGEIGRNEDSGFLLSDRRAHVVAFSL